MEIRKLWRGESERREFITGYFFYFRGLWDSSKNAASLLSVGVLTDAEMLLVTKSNIKQGELPVTFQTDFNLNFRA